jgi:hypothetical protein
VKESDERVGLATTHERFKSPNRLGIFTVKAGGDILD